VRETRWLQALADDPASRGFPHGIVAFADLAAENVEEILAGHSVFPNMRGIRQSLIRRRASPSARLPSESPSFARNFGLLRRYGLSFDLQLFHDGAPFGAELAARHPDVPFILTHTGWPMQSDPDYLEAWRTGLCLLSERPNVAVKLSGFGFLDRRWTVESIRPLILQTIDIFGIDRCTFASNFPVDGMAQPYRTYWDAFDAITRPFNDTERMKLFSGNAERIYRL